MQLIKYPDRKQWSQLLERPQLDTASLESRVLNILKEIKENGDDAVRRFSLMFDKVSVPAAGVTAAEIAAAGALLPATLKEAILQAKKNIERFHASQRRQEEVVETMPGIKCWRRSMPIERVGLYIPGGTAPLFSTVLMLGVPARLAGCSDIILCSPPDKEGNLHPAILYAAQLTGITRLFKVGGVQAIGAMAYGTDMIPRVDKIFGPGNQYVTAAKLLVQKEGIAIDMPAGPSEVAVYADESARPDYVAADLLSQAEHGEDSQVLLVVNNEAMVPRIEACLSEQLERLPRKETAAKALSHSKIIVVKNTDDAMDLLNRYAPEHLILASDDANNLAEKVVNAGSVFLGHFSPESVGDYASGTNHTLPTNGYARSYSGVSVDSFVKKITFQFLSEEGLKNIAPTVQALATAEGLEAHSQAVTIRSK